MSTINKVKNFFDGYSNTFDDLYDLQSQSPIVKFFNKFLRYEMYSRYKITISKIKDMERDCKTILDIGTGPGRYCIDLSKFGFETTGIDISINMINLAKSHALNNKINNCNFIHADYLSYNFEKNFDVAILNGFFDYIEDPVEVFLKLKKDSKYILASFPKKWHWLSPQREWKYKLRNCPLYLYTKNQLHKLLNEANINNFEILNNGREFFLIAKTVVK